MCIVSVVTQAIGNQLPPVQQWQYREVADMTEVIRMLSKIDKKLGAKDCYDPTKEEFLKSLDVRLKVLETHFGNR